MRKRYDQVSTLHVIHHGIMPFSVWWGVKFAPGGHSSFFGFLNTFVHIVMYTYYMLAAMGPKVQKYLWWKKYLTIFQMVSNHRRFSKRLWPLQISLFLFLFTDPVCCCFSSFIPVGILEYMQLSNVVRLLYWWSCSSLLLPFLKLL